MILCGSTGSIGLNALILARKYNINISALSCGENISLLNEQIQEFKPKFVRKYADLKSVILNSAKQYDFDVKNGNFPSEDEIYKLNDSERMQLLSYQN